MLLQDRQCCWKRHCEGGAVFSSPYLNTSQRRLYVATLGGRLLCLNPVSEEENQLLTTSLKCIFCQRVKHVHAVLLWSQDSGEVLWSHCRDVPFFSTPNCSSGHVVIGSVDGNIYCVSNAGKPVRIQTCWPDSSL